MDKRLAQILKNKYNQIKDGMPKIQQQCDTSFFNTQEE